MTTMERGRRHGTDEVIGAELEGARSIHQPDHLRPPCPHCSQRLRPGRVLSGWSPGPRRRHHYCLECDAGWAVVPDPGILVEALAAYWLARNGRGPVPVATAEASLAALSLEVPDR